MKYDSTKIQELGTILGVWAHPDDESWSMAGIMTVARLNGQRVVCVTATHGEAGKTANESNWPLEKLRDIRRRELEDAMKCINVTEHEWLDYYDGKLTQADTGQGVGAIADIIRRIQPDSIFTFEREGITGHDDHKTISAWTCEAAHTLDLQIPVFGAIELQEKYDAFGKQLDKRFDIYFNTAKPELIRRDEAALYFALPPEVLTMKMRCLRAQESQTAAMFEDPAMAEYLRCIAESEHFIRLR